MVKAITAASKNRKIEGMSTGSRVGPSCSDNRGLGKGILARIGGRHHGPVHRMGPQRAVVRHPPLCAGGRRDQERFRQGREDEPGEELRGDGLCVHCPGPPGRTLVLAVAGRDDEGLRARRAPGRRGQRVLHATRRGSTGEEARQKGAVGQEENQIYD